MINNISLKKNYAYNILNQLVAFLVPVIMIPYISRVLGADNIGVYSYCFSIVTIFSSLGRFGLNTYGQVVIAQHREKKSCVKKNVTEIFIARTILLLITIIFFAIFSFSSKTYKKAFFLFSIYFISDEFDFTWLYYAFEDFKSVATRNLITKILNLILVLFFIKSTNDFYIYIVIMQLSICVSNFLLFMRIKKYINKKIIPINVIFMHIKKSSAYFVPTIANVIYNVMDKSMLGAIGKSTYQSGCYEQAYKIIGVSQYFLLAIGTTTLPRLVYYFSNDKIDEATKIIKKSIDYIYFIIFPIITVLFVEAPMIVSVFLGKGFDESIIIIRILSILVFFAVFNYNLGNQVLVSQKKQKEYNIGVCIGAILNFSLNLILIPIYRAKGAAVASLLAEIIIFIIFIFFSRKTIQLSFFVKVSFIKYIFLSICMGAVIYIFNRILEFHIVILQMVLINLIAILFYFLFLVITKDSNLESVLTFIKKLILKSRA